MSCVKQCTIKVAESRILHCKTLAERRNKNNLIWRSEKSGAHLTPNEGRLHFSLRGSPLSVASRGALRHFQHAYQIALMTKINLNAKHINDRGVITKPCGILQQNRPFNSNPTAAQEKSQSAARILMEKSSRRLYAYKKRQYKRPWDYSCALYFH